MVKILLTLFDVIILHIAWPRLINASNNTLFNLHSQTCAYAGTLFKQDVEVSCEDPLCTALVKRLNQCLLSVCGGGYRISLWSLINTLHYELISPYRHQLIMQERKLFYTLRLMTRTDTTGNVLQLLLRTIRLGGNCQVDLFMSYAYTSIKGKMPNIMRFVSFTETMDFWWTLVVSYILRWVVLRDGGEGWEIGERAPGRTLMTFVSLAELWTITG